MNQLPPGPVHGQSVRTVVPKTKEWSYGRIVDFKPNKITKLYIIQYDDKILVKKIV